MNKIEQLKEAEKAYQLSMDWYHREKVTESEYLSSIDKYKGYTPDEIIIEMCKIIKNL